MLTIKNILYKIEISKSMSSIIRSINKNDDLLLFIIKLTDYLNNDIDIKQRIYHIRHKIIRKIICDICNQNDRIWDNKHSHYRNWCGCECKKIFMIENRDNIKEIDRIKKIKKTKKERYNNSSYNNREKSRKTCLNKYGVDSFSKTDKFKEMMVEKIGVISPFSLEENREKSRKTLFDKYGVIHNSKIPQVVYKRTQTFLENYGTKTPSENNIIKNKIKLTNNIKYNGNSPMCDPKVREKSIKTLMGNYGVSTPLDNEEIRDKYKNTMLNRYGYEYWLQDDHNHEWMMKQTYKYKKYTLNDKEIYLQGYEDYVLYEILLKKYKINDISISNSDITDKIGKIHYMNNGNSHRYYPDFYIKSMNKIYEVKSEYTYNKDLEVNLLKKSSCENMNIIFEFLIIDRKIYNGWKSDNTFINK